MRRGYTLVEILVVIVIIAILVAILLPVLSRARGKAYEATCLSNQQQAVKDVLMQVQDNKESFPGALGVEEEQTWRGGMEARLLRCPASNNDGSVKSPCIGFNMYLYGQGYGDVEKPSSAIMTADARFNLLRDKNDVEPKRHGTGYIAGFVDGHAKLIDPATQSVIYGPGEEGNTYYSLCAVNVAVSFTAADAATGKSTGAVEGENLLITNDSGGDLTVKVTVSGGTTPPTKGFNPAKDNLTIHKGMGKGFLLYCYTDDSGEKVDTVFTFGEGSNVVTITVPKPRLPESETPPTP
jgi:prepilin-type N-terminal cleavage/methylation domain-containing protein/prepilin-type processing-associated H-X9-DG protein